MKSFHDKNVQENVCFFILSHNKLQHKKLNLIRFLVNIKHNLNGPQGLQAGSSNVHLEEKKKVLERKNNQVFPNACHTFVVIPL